MKHKLSVFSFMVLMFISGIILTVWTQQTMAQSSSLPIIDNLDDGAPLWNGGIAWQHSEANGISGKGWGTHIGFAELQWDRQIDLTTAIKPKLRLMTRQSGATVMAFLIITSDNESVSVLTINKPAGSWQNTVIDLTPYRGHIIELKWMIMNNGPITWMMDNVVVEDAAPATSTLPPVNNTVTAPPPPPVNNTVTAPPPPPVNNTVTAPPPPPVNNTVTAPPPPPVNNTVTPPPPPPVNNTVTPPPPPPVNNTATPPPPNDPTGTSPTATHTSTPPEG